MNPFRKKEDSNLFQSMLSSPGSLAGASPTGQQASSLSPFPGTSEKGDPYSALDPESIFAHPLKTQNETQNGAQNGMASHPSWQSSPHSSFSSSPWAAYTEEALAHSASKSPYVGLKPGSRFLDATPKQASSQPIPATVPSSSAPPLAQQQAPSKQTASSFPSTAKAASPHARRTKASGSSSRRPRGRKSSNFPWRYTIPLLGLLLPAVLGYGILRVLKNNKPASPRKSEQPATALPPGAVPSTSRFLTPLQTAEAFLQAPTRQERLALCRDLDGSLARKMEDFPHRTYPNASINTEGLSVGNFLILFPWGDENLPSDKIIMEKTPDGYRVDWESFVIWQELSWPTIIKACPSAPLTIRCSTKEIQPAHSLWSKHNGYRCFELIHPTRPDTTLRGYLRVPKENIPPLVSHFLKNPKDLYTLRIKCDALSSNPGEVLITEVKAKGWVVKGTENTP